MRAICNSLTGVVTSGALRVAIAMTALWSCAYANTAAAADKFHLQDATIDDIQTAITSGEMTCKGIVQAYLNRVKAYNGICTKLITPDGKPVAAAFGAMRSGAPLKFPRDTVAVSTLLSNYDQYSGTPLDFGRMEPTISDPGVKQQYGMVVGIPDAGQVNALETVNIRGERSVTCKGKFDAAPGTPLPKDAPSECDKFRQQPDALERAAQLDAQYGSHPDLKKMPMYCAVITVKDWYDVTDMRSTGGNDVNYAMDAAPLEMTVVKQLRDKGAIISGVSIASEVSFKGTGPNTAKASFVGSGNIRGSWGGNVCSPYDTERAAGPSSGGAGASVSTNMATCSICETTGGSCREPANANSTSFVTTKGLTSEFGSATAQFINHRPGVICHKLGDAARVIDAMMDPQHGSYDSRDFLTAQPPTLGSQQPYATSVLSDKDIDSKPLKGLRVGIVREFMVKHVANDAAISDLSDLEFKNVLRDKLGADIVESVDPKFGDDPYIPNMKYTFADAFAEILPITTPEYFFQKDSDGKLEFAVPGYDVTSRDYLVKLSMHQAPLSPKLNLRRVLRGIDDGGRNDFMIAKYLAERGDARVKDMKSYAANSKWRSEDMATGALNMAAQDTQDTRGKDGLDRIKMREVFRLVLQKVMRENRIDVFVHPDIGVPMWKTYMDREPTVDGRGGGGFGITDLLGVPEITVPAGFNQIEYAPHFELSTDKKSYKYVAGTEKSLMKHPIPFSLEFWSGPGDEAVMLKITSAYEAATHHSKPPAAFPSLKGEP